MKVQVEELSPIEKKLSIEVDNARVADELTRAYSALGRQVKVPGFRPGKIPRRILEQRYRASVEDDVIQRVVQQAYLDAIREHKVEPVSQPTVSNARALKANEPFTFEARVEVKPQVQAKDYRELPLPKSDVVVDDAAVEQQLTNMRESLARLEPVEGGREVGAPGDFATIDYEAKLEGKEFPGSKAEGVTVEIAPGELVQSNIAALEGVKIGESKELDYTFPADYQVEEVRGKAAQFRIVLKELKRKVTPELDDAFARETGQAETLEALRAKLRSDLERAQKNQKQAEEREAILKALVERNGFEVPKAMVERALDSMLEGALRSMARSGFDPRRLNLDFMKVREEMRERAVQEVKGSLILESIAGQESIAASDEDIEKKIADLAQESGQPVASVKQYFKSPDERRGLGLQLREQKTLEFLRGTAKYA